MNATVKPIVKWVGGKSGILPELVGRLPDIFVHYYELFCGGAALRLSLPPERYAVVADANRNLVQTYSQVVADCPGVRAQLEVLRDEYIAATQQAREAMYYQIRADFRLDAVEWADGPCQAARFLFLNRTCFNGLYRENSSGEFNASFGHYERPLIVPDNMEEFSRTLVCTELLHGDFREVAALPKGGDFVYLDPPYDDTFSGYIGRGFATQDLLELSAHCSRFDEMGVYWMVSNSDTPLVREAFRGYRIETIMAPRLVSRNGSDRGAVQEVIIRNY